MRRRGRFFAAQRHTDYPVSILWPVFCPEVFPRTEQQHDEAVRLSSTGVVSCFLHSAAHGFARGATGMWLSRYRDSDDTIPQVAPKSHRTALFFCVCEQSGPPWTKRRHEAVLPPPPRISGSRPHCLWLWLDGSIIVAPAFIATRVSSRAGSVMEIARGGLPPVLAHSLLRLAVWPPQGWKYPDCFIQLSKYKKDLLLYLRLERAVAPIFEEIHTKLPQIASGIKNPLTLFAVERRVW